jgi:hypothetical protein
MKYFIYIIAFIGLPLQATSQVNDKHQLNKFPVDKSPTILLLSFSPPAVDEPIIIGDTTKQRVTSANNTFRDTLGYKEVREIVPLSAKGKEQLSRVVNTLVCNGPLKKNACYDPRNAVLFIDKNGKIIAELEICFECLGYITRPRDFYIRDNMRECMYDALKKIFADAGVKYGIVPEK